MPGIDDTCANLLHESMSRPFRLVLPAVCAATSLGFTACVGTIYDKTYSYNNTHFKAPADKKEASAADVLKSLEGNKKGGAAPDGLPAPDAIPGLPGAVPDPAAPAPGGMPAIPGLPPPAAPPPVPPPAT